FDGGAVVVAVQPFALVPLVANKVPGTEGQVVLGDPDFVVFSSHRRIPATALPPPADRRGRSVRLMALYTRRLRSAIRRGANGVRRTSCAGRRQAERDATGSPFGACMGGFLGMAWRFRHDPIRRPTEGSGLRRSP